MSEYEANSLYGEHKGKSFYDELIAQMTQGCTIAVKLSGEDAVETVRRLNGATKTEEAMHGTIRHLFGTPNVGPKNAVHGSATPEDAERELKIFFGPNM